MSDPNGATTTKTDVVLVGAGIMSATLGTLLRLLEPNWSITLIERLDGAAAESSAPSYQGFVFQLGVFGAVKVNRGAPDRDAGTVPVVVDVREAPFHTVRLGGGIGIDALRHE